MGIIDNIKEKLPEDKMFYVHTTRSIFRFIEDMFRFFELDEEADAMISGRGYNIHTTYETLQMLIHIEKLIQTELNGIRSETLQNLTVEHSEKYDKLMKDYTAYMGTFEQE